SRVPSFCSSTRLVAGGDLGAEERSASIGENLHPNTPSSVRPALSGPASTRLSERRELGRGTTRGRSRTSPQPAVRMPLAGWESAWLPDLLVKPPCFSGRSSQCGYHLTRFRLAPLHRGHHSRHLPAV